MNRLAEIEAFIAVADAGSQLAAAEKLNIAVSAINRRIKDRYSPGTSCQTICSALKCSIKPFILCLDLQFALYVVV